MKNFKEFDLNKNNTKYSQQAVDIYENIFKEIEAYNYKKVEAANKLKQLKTELLKLTDKMVVNALDENELAKIKKQRRDIQYEIEDLKLIYEVDVDTLIKQKHKKTISDLNNTLAENEYNEYTKKIKNEMEELKKIYEENIKKLETLCDNHPFKKLHGLYTRFAYLGRK
jgi:small-conductance mechanosensitive channel